MPAPTPQDLVTAASCYLCAGVSLVEGMELALLAEIVDSSPSSPTVPPAIPQILIDQAACYVCAGASPVEGMELAILANIVSTPDNP